LETGKRTLFRQTQKTEKHIRKKKRKPDAGTARRIWGKEKKKKWGVLGGPSGYNPYKETRKKLVAKVGADLRGKEETYPKHIKRHVFAASA